MRHASPALPPCSVTFYRDCECFSSGVRIDYMYESYIVYGAVDCSIVIINRVHCDYSLLLGTNACTCVMYFSKLVLENLYSCCREKLLA